MTASATFETPLREAGIDVRHITDGRNVPMYKTNRLCRPAADAITRDIGSQIRRFRQHGLVPAGFNNVQYRAALRVTLGIEQEIKRPFSRQANHIRLGHSRRHTCRR